MTIRNWCVQVVFVLVCVTGVFGFDVEDVIHPVVKKLGDPAFYLSDPPIFAISTSSEKASKHIKQGIAVFNSPWDFEAYRHFCAAAKPIQSV